MLKCRDIRAGYGASVHQVLSGLSLDFQPAHFTALVGPNGCGKSTLLKAMVGVLPHQSGHVSLHGEALDDLPRKQRAQRLAYLPQDMHCPEYISVGELVELGGYARRNLFGGVSKAQKENYRAALKTVGLSDFERAQITTLSGGQRQRAWIAMVLAQAADAILLDEPVNHLDLRYQIAVLELIRSLAKEQGKIIVCVLHDLNLAAAYADRIVMLDKGHVMSQGTVEQALTPAALRKVYGVEAEVFQRDGRFFCAAKGLIA